MGRDEVVVERRLARPRCGLKWGRNIAKAFRRQKSGSVANRSKER